MQLQKIKEGMVPSGGGVFKCWNGVSIERYTCPDLKEAVLEYYLQMGRNAQDAEPDIAAQICARSPSSCQTVEIAYMDGIPHHEIFKDGYVENLVANANRVADKANSLEMVSLQEAEQRARICMGCPKNQKRNLCPKCQSHAQRIFGLVLRGRYTSADSRLESCSCWAMPTASIVHLKHREGANPLTDVPSQCWR